MRPISRALWFSGAVALVCAVSTEPAALAVRSHFRESSIKRATLPTPHSWRLEGRDFSATTVTLTTLISKAYEIPVWRIAGRPKWADEELFDVHASAAQPASPGESLLMLRSLLEDEFRLRTQMEVKQVPVDLLIRRPPVLSSTPV